MSTKYYENVFNNTINVDALKEELLVITNNATRTKEIRERLAIHWVINDMKPNVSYYTFPLNGNMVTRRQFEILQSISDYLFDMHGITLKFFDTTTVKKIDNNEKN